MAQTVTPMRAGDRYGRLVLTGARALHHNPSDGHSRAAWECKCDCGATKFIVGQSLRNGRTRSCGCLRRDMLRARHAHAANPAMALA